MLGCLVWLLLCQRLWVNHNFKSITLLWKVVPTYPSLHLIPSCAYAGTEVDKKGGQIGLKLSWQNRAELILIQLGLLGWFTI